MKFGGKQTMADKVAVASRNKSGKAQDKKPAPKAKVTVRPTGGIKNLTKGPQGAKLTITKKF